MNKRIEPLNYYSKRPSMDMTNKARFSFTNALQGFMTKHLYGSSFMGPERGHDI